MPLKPFKRSVWNAVVPRRTIGYGPTRDSWGMQEPPVGRRIAATVSSPDDMMVVPSRQSGYFLVTQRAETVLLFPEVQQMPSPFEVVCHLHLQAFLEVHFPLRVIRIRHASDLHMSLNRHVSCSKEFPVIHKYFIFGCNWRLLTCQLLPMT
jgi:hypothetical protein